MGNFDGCSPCAYNCYVCPWSPDNAGDDVADAEVVDAADGLMSMAQNAEKAVLCDEQDHVGDAPESGESAFIDDPGTLLAYQTMPTRVLTHGIHSLLWLLVFLYSRSSRGTIR